MNGNPFERLPQRVSIDQIQRLTRTKRETWLSLLEIAIITPEEKQRATDTINDFSRRVMACNDLVSIDDEVAHFKAEIYRLSTPLGRGEVRALVGQISNDANELRPLHLQK